MQLFVRLSEANLNEHILLYPGKFEHGLYGKFEVGEGDIDNAVKNFEGGVGTRFDGEGGKMLPANYQHAGHAPDPEAAKAAGWIKKIFKKDSRLYMAIEWTEKAVEYIKKKEYLFISPEFHPNWKDEEGKARGFTVLGVALTNYNFLKKNQLAIALSEDGFVTMDLAEWDAGYINDLPDSAFAVISAGGKKDEDGKTVPRSLRHLPYKNKNGEVDLPHLRNALARLEQTSLGTQEKTKARARLNAVAKEAGVGETKGAKEMEELLKLLGAEDEKGAIEKVNGLVSKEAELTQKIADLEKSFTESEDKVKKLIEDDKTGELKALTDEITRLKEDVKRGMEAENTLAKMQAEVEIDKHINCSEPKILPKQRDFFIRMYLKDKGEFDKYIELAEPVLNLKTKGSSEVSTEDDPEKIIDAKVKELMAAEKIDYGTALKKVQKSEKALVDAYMQRRNK